MRFFKRKDQPLYHPPLRPQWLVREEQLRRWLWVQEMQLRNWVRKCRGLPELKYDPAEFYPPPPESVEIPPKPRKKPARIEDIESPAIPPRQRRR